MLNMLYRLFNTMSVTVWIIVIFTLKEKWTFNEKLPSIIITISLFMITIGAGALSLFLTRFLGKENLEKCIKVEQADASFLPAYIGYFLVAFSIGNAYQLLVAFVSLTIFLFFVHWQYFNVTYLFFGYHCYHVTTDTGTKLFIICKNEIRSPENLKFNNLRRINNTTYIDKGEIG